MPNAKLPWRITEPNEKKTREIVAADGSTVAKLTALDLDNAELIVRCVNASLEPAAQPVDDLQSLCKRLVRELRKFDPENKAAKGATDYLQRTGAFNPLRAAAQPVDAPKPALDDYMCRKIEEALRPSGMRLNDGNARIDGGILLRLYNIAKSKQVAQPVQQPRLPNPDEIRGIAKNLATSASDSPSPSEYVAAGWRAAMQAAQPVDEMLVPKDLFAAMRAVLGDGLRVDDCGKNAYLRCRHCEKAITMDWQREIACYENFEHKPDCIIMKSKSCQQSSR